MERSSRTTGKVQNTVANAETQSGAGWGRGKGKV